jgi:predicted DsbA family dithiol-disulfide isomerase
MSSTRFGRCARLGPEYADERWERRAGAPRLGHYLIVGPTRSDCGACNESGNATLAVARRKLVTKPRRIDVFFDYSCSYVYFLAAWLRDVKRELDGDLEINWRFFPLEQLNSPDGPDFTLWDHPEDFPSRGRGAFHAAIAARRQGPDAFEAFHYGLLDAKHVQRKNHGRRSVHMAVAEAAGLDLGRFERDLDDMSLLQEIGNDYNEARVRWGVFGTPTLVIDEQHLAFLKLRDFVPQDEAMDVWRSTTDIVVARPYVTEIKRPSIVGEDE